MSDLRSGGCSLESEDEIAQSRVHNWRNIRAEPRHFLPRKLIQEPIDVGALVQEFRGLRFDQSVPPVNLAPSRSSHEGAGRYGEAPKHGESGEQGATPQLFVLRHDRTPPSVDRYQTRVRGEQLRDNALEQQIIGQARKHPGQGRLHAQRILDRHPRARGCAGRAPTLVNWQIREDPVCPTGWSDF